MLVNDIALLRGMLALADGRKGDLGGRAKSEICKAEPG